ncbi:MAG: hypothetical protein EZS28_007144 [Streblomastix strix]|uniref:Uncharacterized protein n=1 Tax=Streblomastix strix TaxID=222440 RepID=A0A5J4WQY0_9EUKA|nr:MAG: hypothetical protein EZS28_007144 [Streblomastix strix]
MPHTIGSSCFKTRRNYENDEMNDVKDEKDKIDLENQFGDLTFSQSNIDTKDGRGGNVFRLYENEGREE